MRILFLAPCRGIAGGLRVIAAYGNLLAQSGHEVTIAYPRPRLARRERVRRALRRLLHGETDFFHGFSGRLLEVEDMYATNLPPADIVVATAYETAYWAARLEVPRGRVVYMIQGFETWNADPERVFATYELGFRNVSVSSYLSELVGSRSRLPDPPVILNGCDFAPAPEDALDPVRDYDAGMVYSDLPHKNSADGLEAIRLLLAADPKRRAVIFGAETPPYLPERADFVRRPSQTEISRIYGNTRVWLASSRQEGFCLPALEAMRHGCAVVSYDNGGIRDIVVDPGEATVLRRDASAPELAFAAERYLNDPRLLAETSRRAYWRSLVFDWRDSLQKLEVLFEECILQEQQA